MRNDINRRFKDDDEEESKEVNETLESQNDDLTINFNGLPLKASFIERQTI